MPPSSARLSRDLSLSVGRPGPHAFAVRLSAARLRRQRVHRIPHPTSVTIAIRPSYSGRDGENKPHISEKRKPFIFAARAGQEFAMTSDLPVGQRNWSSACIAKARIPTNNLVHCHRNSFQTAGLALIRSAPSAAMRRGILERPAVWISLSLRRRVLPDQPAPQR